MELLGRDETAWRRAAELLEAGRIVALPTDTVYGVAARVAARGAVARLFPLKDRTLAKPVAVLVADADQASELVEFSERASALAARFWPGALTIVAPRRAGFEVDLGGAGSTIGVRCPDHRELIGLCRRVGPIATTSANRSGQPTPPDAVGVAAALAGTEVAAVLDGGHLAGRASTVVRVDGERIDVLREGPFSAADLAASHGAVS